MPHCSSEPADAVLVTTWLTQTLLLIIMFDSEVKQHVFKVLTSVVVMLLGTRLADAALVTTWLSWTLDLTTWLDS